MSYKNTVTKSDVGLSLVDNTSDASKPISTLTQTALNTKQASNTYTSYQAIVTQVTTGNPSAVVFTNTLGATITWARSSTGVYTATASGAVFTANKTVVVLSQPLATLVSYFAVITSTSVITITSGLLAVGVSVVTDGLFTNSLIEIRVYS